MKTIRWAVAAALSTFAANAVQPALGTTPAGLRSFASTRLATRAPASKSPIRETVLLDLPAQPLTEALKQWARKAGFQVVFYTNTGAGLTSPPLSGAYTPDQALHALLAPFGLRADYLDGKTVAVRLASDVSMRIPQEESGTAPIRLAQAAQAAPGGARPAAAPAGPPVRSPSADAQDAASGASSDQIQDIVVTATRTDERLSRVPASISAFNPAALEQKNVKTIADLQGIAPGLVFSPNSNTIAIRGISSTAAVPTTGVYIDDTPIQLFNVGDSAQNTVPALYDLERVEVLRGPQGTLFGAGAEGGVVRYITPQPSLTQYSGSAHAEMGFIENGAQDYEIGLAGGGPIIQDKLAFRASAYFRNSGGWIDHIDYRDASLRAQNFNSQRVSNFRLAATWAVSDALSVTGAVLWQDRWYDGNNNLYEFYSDPSRGKYINANPSTVPNNDRYWMPSLKINYNMGSVEVISNTSMFDRHQETGYDGTEYEVGVLNGFRSIFLPGVLNPLVTAAGIRTPIPYSARGLVFNTQNDISEELRVQSTDSSQRLTWVLGMFYSSNVSRNVEHLIDPQLPEIGTFLTGLSLNDLLGEGLVNTVDSYYANNKIRDGQTSFFGEANFKITSRLKLTAGLRVASTHFTFDNTQDGAINGGPTGGTGTQRERPVAPKVGMSYQQSDANLFYATVAKGFRTGGVNAPVPFVICQEGIEQLGLKEAPATYNSDSTVSYEVGSKNRLADGQVLWSSSLFYTKWKNIQQGTTIPICAYQYVANLGTAVSQGFDSQVTAQLPGHVSVDAQLGYTDAHYTSTISNGSGGTIISSGDALPGPRITVSLGTQWDFNVMQHDSFVRMDYRYAGANSRNLPINDPASVSYDLHIPDPPSTNYFTARTGMNFDNWDTSFFIDNLFNSTTILTRSHRSRSWPAYTETTWRPRTFMLAATLHF